MEKKAGRLGDGPARPVSSERSEVVASGKKAQYRHHYMGGVNLGKLTPCFR